MTTPTRRSFFAFALALMVALASIAVAAPRRRSSDVINFRLRTTEGGEITSEMVRGEVVVLAFGASWLPLSRKQIEGVQKLADQYAEQNLRVYWVSTESDSPKSKNYATDNQLRDFAKKHGLKVAVLRDPDGKFLKELRIDQLPSIVILDRTGNVNVPIIGGLDPGGNLADQLATRLEPLLNAGK
ncbi:MAG TPA: TlpA disulfide reductase family protein [Pyrinomonadaceae bacterium]|jgi:peroxiredoxin